MKKYYFTFGTNHYAPAGTPLPGISLGGYYVIVEAESEEKARHIFSNKYGVKWAFTYLESQADDAVHRFNLTLFETIVAPVNN